MQRELALGRTEVDVRPGHSLSLTRVAAMAGRGRSRPQLGQR